MSCTFLFFASQGNETIGHVTRDIMEAALAQVVPAVKNTPEFVTIPDVTWSDVGGLEETKTRLHNQFMVPVVLLNYCNSN